MPKPDIAPEPPPVESAQDLICILCSSRQMARLYEGSDKLFRGPGRFTYWRCAGCRLVLLHPRPQAQDMGQYYPDYVTAVRSDQPFRQWLKRAVTEHWYGYAPNPQAPHRRPVRFLLKALTFPAFLLLRHVPDYRPGGRVLDIGCGSGGYLAFLASLGWTCHGVEPGPNSRRYAREILGLTIDQGPLSDCKFPDSYFDVVTMWHVIEHFPDPLDTLREVRRILKPDGVIMLSTPNIESLETRLFAGSWYGLDPPRHFYLLSPSTLRAMLDRTGFVTTRFRYQHHPTTSSRSLLYALEECGFLRIRGIVARWIWLIELGLRCCFPLRWVLGHGGIIQVQARKSLAGTAS